MTTRWRGAAIAEIRELPEWPLPVAPTLTPREMDILRRCFAGETTKEVAHALHVGIQQIKNHKTRIYQKLDVGSLWAAFAKAGLLMTVEAEMIRIAALRDEARAELQAMADSLAP